ncbi:MAG: M48 family metallopeptidase [Gammaproteobacteria bacterium]
MVNAYSIRESAKARRVCLKISPLGQVEVVVPRGFDHRRIPALVHGKQAWINKTLQRVNEQRQWLGQSAHDTLPDIIAMQAIDEVWQVEYKAIDSRRVTLSQSDGARLIVRGAVDNTSLCKSVLRLWLARKGQTHLRPWLEQISHETALPFRQVRIRGQKTRWGSCSRQKNINLNYKLLFLPAPLVRCVLVHELCHTIQLNHSPKFWALVEKKEPGYKALDAELRTARRHVPGWVE